MTLNLKPKTTNDMSEEITDEMIEQNYETVQDLTEVDSWGQVNIPTMIRAFIKWHLQQLAQVKGELDKAERENDSYRAQEAEHFMKRDILTSQNTALQDQVEGLREAVQFISNHCTKDTEISFSELLNIRSICKRELSTNPPTTRGVQF